MKEKEKTCLISKQYIEEKALNKLYELEISYLLRITRSYCKSTKDTQSYELLIKLLYLN